VRLTLAVLFLPPKAVVFRLGVAHSGRRREGGAQQGATEPPPPQENDVHLRQLAKVHMCLNLFLPRFRTKIVIFTAFSRVSQQASKCHYKKLRESPCRKCFTKKKIEGGRIQSRFFPRLFIAFLYVSQQGDFKNGIKKGGVKCKKPTSKQTYKKPN
jgi:hypothetical protein